MPRSPTCHDLIANDFRVRAHKRRKTDFADAPEIARALGVEEGDISGDEALQVLILHPPSRPSRLCSRPIRPSPSLQSSLVLLLTLVSVLALVLVL